MPITEEWVWIPTVKILLGFSSIKSVMLLASPIINRKLQTTHIVKVFAPLTGMTMDLPVKFLDQFMARLLAILRMMLV